MTTIAEIYNWFMTGKKPTQAQFWASWGSFWHKEEAIPQTSINGLVTVLNAKTENDQFNAHKVASDAHAALFLAKENKSDKGVAGGYVPLNELIKISYQYLNIIDDLVTGGSDNLLSAEQGLILQTQITAINTLLSSDDVNLDTVQEIVDAIKEVETYLSTILVNDLTTGGATKALTAEMGKTLKVLVDALSTNKLDRGGYTGTAQNLKTEIDDIYQPDVLIRSVPPTRVGDTFTYPVGEYEYLLSKTHHINAANFPVTILPATTDYKRTDLIYGKPDNTIAKLGGTESTTVAIRPDVPAGCIGISFINVFGAVVSDPTPITKEISIQDSLGNQRFNVTDYVRFKGASFNAGAKQIEIDPLVAGVIFVSNTGNDSTAEPENRNKPYLTLDKAITDFFLYSQITKIEIVSSTTFTITRSLNDNTTLKTFNLYSDVSPTINITYNGTYGRSSQSLVFNLPNAVLNLAPTSSAFFGNNSNRDFVSIKVKTISVNALFGLGSIIGGLTLEATNGTFTGGGALCGGCVLQAINSIKINYITFSGANARLVGTDVSSGIWNLDFDSIIHNNTFFINSNCSGTWNITHGNISPSSFSSWVDYCKSNANTNIVFKTGAQITSNLGFGRFNVNYTLTFTGIANYSNTDYFINGKNGAAALNFVNAFITCKAFAIGRVSNTINIESSTIKVTSYFADLYPLAGVDTIVQPIFKFTGMCFILGIGLADNFNLITTSQGFSTSVKVDIDVTKSVLYTNGKFDRQKINLIESPLNQYYDTTQRQLVLVDEKEEIVNKVLDSTKTYIINGTITLLTGEYILVPAGGLTISGYGYDTSGFIKNVTGQEIFQSAVGGCGNLTLKDCFFNSGLGSVFNLTDATGTHAIEMNDINFNSCSSLGLLSGFRQFTGTTCGIYGCSNGFQLKGTWSGFKFTNSNVISFLTGGTLIRKDTDTIFSNRLYLDLNFSCQTGAKLSDFGASNFTADELFQINNTLCTYNGSKDATTNTTIVLPNITPNDPKARFTNCLGITESAVKFKDLKSPDGNVWRLAVDNAGAIATSSV